MARRKLRRNAFLLALNHELVAREQRGESVAAPGLPQFVKDPEAFITDDCVRMPE